MAESLNIVFAGTPDFAVPALEHLIASQHQVVAVYTQPDRPAGRGRKLTPSPVKQTALAHDITVLQPESLKDAAAQQQLAELKPDLMVVVAYGLILPPEVLAIPRLGCLNIHGSLLPRWRGAAPIQRAILAGDSQTGVTIMQMDAGLDTGDMLYKAALPINAQDSAQSLHDRLAVLGAEALMSSIEQILDGSVQPEKQDDAEACYAAKLSKQEAKLDWSCPATELLRQVNAFNPWPVAQTTWQGQVLRVWQAEVGGSCDALPGTVVAADGKGIQVASGDGVLILTRVQLPGGRPMAASDFLNAHDIQGDRLGQDAS
jgi:methionyl-tRNA formyltransferase